MKVMIIDADILTKIVLKKIFSEIETLEPFFIESSIDYLGEESVKFKPNLAFVCIRKGKQPSISIFSQIFREKIGCELIVIADSSYQQFLREFTEIDEIEFLSKPFSKKELLNIIQNRRSAQKIMTNLYVEKFRHLVIKKDYMAMYNQIPNFTELIMKNYKNDKQQTINQLNEMVSAGLSLMNCTNETQQKRYKEKMSFSKEVLESKFRTQFKLCTIFNEVFQQRSIQKRPQMIPMFDYIEKSIYDDLSLVEASDYCKISQSYLSRILKENYNIGFNTYIQIQKVFLAKKAFYYNDDKIIDVSFQLSYSEPSYFCKVFKKLEGKTPTDMKSEMEQTRKLMMS